MDEERDSQAFETLEDGAAPDASVRFDRPMIGGFIVEAEVGRGGMGVVLRAHEPDLERRVALKVMAASRSSQPRFRQLFEEESRRAAALEHPNVLPVYRTGEESGRLYIAMRYVEDGSLKASSAAADASRWAWPSGSWPAWPTRWTPPTATGSSIAT